MKRNLLCTALLALLLTVLFAVCASAADVRPLELNPDEIDLNNGKFSVTFRDEYWDEDDDSFTIELYLEDRYDAEQVKALVPGDTVLMNGATFTVQEIVIHDGNEALGEDPVYEVLPEEEYYGYLVFTPNADGTFCALIDDWVPVTPVGEMKVTLPLSDRFTYVSITSGEENEPEGPDAFMEDIGMFGGFIAWNTSCVIEDGVLVKVTHSSYPWGPEDYWPGEEEETPDPDDSEDSSSSSASSDDASGDVPVWKFCHALSAEQLETAVITGSQLDCEEGPIPYEMTEEEKEELRTLAMYGVVTGRENEEMVTGGTWLYSFETPEGDYIMTIEMYRGLLVGRDGMYRYTINK